VAEFELTDEDIARAWFGERYGLAINTVAPKYAVDFARSFLAAVTSGDDLDKTDAQSLSAHKRHLADMLATLPGRPGTGSTDLLTFSDGIEAAAAWHDLRANPPHALGMRARHAFCAEKIRALDRGNEK